MWCSTPNTSVSFSSAWLAKWVPPSLINQSGMPNLDAHHVNARVAGTALASLVTVNSHSFDNLSTSRRMYLFPVSLGQIRK